MKRFSLSVTDDYLHLEMGSGSLKREITVYCQQASYPKIELS